ncbi:MAG: flavodoxin family protein [Oscillospiraceae bacterium]|nr:flavodoxin family protein [Oscillospiraceae bacterium]
MNVLVINGSPRKSGNTAALVDAFAEEAKKAGHNVFVKQIGNMDIRGCKNCDACRNSLNGECAQTDDMCDIFPLMRECEVLVIASPIYYYSLTGQTHCFIERCYAFERLPKLKKAALLLTAGGGGFTSAIQTYKDAIVGHMGAQNMGVITASGNQARSLAKLDEARKIAKKL